MTNRPPSAAGKPWGLALTNSRKTECVHGHSFTNENTYRWTDRDGRPGRYCVECNRRRNRERYRRKVQSA
jgi:hypothetical protein